MNQGKRRREKKLAKMWERRRQTEISRINREAVDPESLRAALSRFSEEGILICCAAISKYRGRERWPPHALAGLVRETALERPTGTKEPSPDELLQLVQMFISLQDPWLISRIGIDLSQVVATRVLADQVLHQRNTARDIVRTAIVLGEADVDWPTLIGMSIEDWLVLVLWTSFMFERHDGPLARDWLVAQAKSGIPPIGDQLPILLGELCSDLELLAQHARALMDRMDADSKIRSPSPLRDRPIVELSTGSVVVPVKEYLDLALAPIGLYIRAIRDRKADAVGHSFQMYVLSYARAALDPEKWMIVDVDELELGASKRADVLIWPRGGVYVLILEAKSASQLLEVQLGSVEGRLAAVAHYRDWFDQTDETVGQFDVIRSQVPEFPTDPEVFGVAVTMERHLVGVRDGQTTATIGLVPVSQEPAASPSTRAPARVVGMEDLEVLLDAADAGGTDVVRQALEDLFGAPATATRLPACLKAMGIVQRQNVLVRETYQRLIQPASSGLSPQEFQA